MQLGMERLYLQGRLDEAAEIALRLLPYQAARIRPARYEREPSYEEPSPLEVQPLSAAEEQRLVEIRTKYGAAVAEFLKSEPSAPAGPLRPLEVLRRAIAHN